MKQKILSLAVMGSLVWAGCGGRSGERDSQHLGSWTPSAAIRYEGGGPPNPGKETPLIRKVVYELMPGGVRLRHNLEGKKNLGVDLASYRKDGLLIMFDDAYDMSTGMVRFRTEDEMGILKDGFETIYRRLPVSASVEQRLWVSPSVESPESLLVLGEQGDYALASKEESSTGTYQVTDSTITFRPKEGEAKEAPLSTDKLDFAGRAFVPLKDPAPDFGVKFFVGKR